MSKTESMDRSASAYEKFMKWSKGSIIQTFAGALLVLGSLVYQIFQDPGQFEFVKIIAGVFIAVAVIEEHFKSKNKSLDLEKDKLNLEEKIVIAEKGLQAQFIKNKHIFGGDVTSLILDKLESYLDTDNVEKIVIKNYKEMIIAIQSKSRKYAGMIENKYKDFIMTMLDDKEQDDVPITSMKKTMIIDKLTQTQESEFTENVEENNKAIDDFNKDFEEEET